MKHVELGFDPRPHQREAHAARLLFRFMVLVWHRRAGKTVFAILELLLDALAFKRKPGQSRGQFGYIAPQLKQAKSVAWDILKSYARLVPGGIDINESELRITLPNGVVVRLFGADNPDSFRGMYFDGVVLDEVAQMKPETWETVLRPALADRLGWAIFIGTPNGTNLFSQLYYDAEKNPDWYADVKRWADTGALPDSEIEQSRREMTPDNFKQEFECDFTVAAQGQLIGLELVLQAQARDLKPASYLYAPRLIGIDVAEMGGDRTCFAPRQGLRAMVPKFYEKQLARVTASHAAESIDRWKPHAVFVDAGAGPGVEVYARLVDMQYDQVTTLFPVDFGGGADEAWLLNKRAEIWWRLRAWMDEGGCLPSGTGIQTDLTAPKFLYKGLHGKGQLESKDAMRARGIRSPDYGDALALTFSYPVAVPLEVEADPVLPVTLRDDFDYPRVQDKGDFDPFSEARR